MAVDRSFMKPGDTGYRTNVDLSQMSFTMEIVSLFGLNPAPVARSFNQQPSKEARNGIVFHMCIRRIFGQGDNFRMLTPH